MPTFNEVVNGLADKQTYERIQGLIQAGLEDIHNHAVRLSALQSKPNMEGLVQLAFPKLTELVGRIENEDRKEAATKPEHRDAPPKVNGHVPQGMWGVRYPYSQKYRSGLSSGSPSRTTRTIYGTFKANESNRGGENLEAQSSND